LSILGWSIINSPIIFLLFQNSFIKGINDPSEYITFHGMRNWAVLMGKLVQEIIYVHSKLMIIDDKYVICGSANINDRSMLGKRDSEVAVFVRDEDFIQSKLNGIKIKAGKYAYSLRKKIFKLHLGITSSEISNIDINDCVCDEFYNFFKQCSRKNTIAYDDVFKCLPSDNISSFNALKKYTDEEHLSQTNPKEVIEFHFFLIFNSSLIIM
jgi:phospholipase D1/2